MKSEIITCRNQVVGASANLTLSTGDVVALKALPATSTYHDVDDPQNAVANSIVNVAVYVGDRDLPFGETGPFRVAGDVECAVGGSPSLGDYAEVDLTTDTLQMVVWSGAGATAIGAGEAEAALKVLRGRLVSAVSGGKATVRLLPPYRVV